MPYSYTPLPTNHGFHSTKRRRIGLILAGLAGLVLFLSGVSLVLRKPIRFIPQKNFQDLHPPNVVDGSSPAASSSTTAVVSTLYTDSYIWGTAVLGYSVRQANVASRLLLPYIEDRISPEALCIARAVGWEPIATPLIKPPHNGKGIYFHFADQYTKLTVWTLDKLGIKKAVYLDSDTLVRRNIDELFDLPFNFGAVPDVHGSKGGFLTNFNAGVLALRPSSSVFNQMMKVLESASYPLDQAEQSFLNLFFVANVVRLPYAYNANLEIKRESPKLWEGLKDEIRVVHYTQVKPFIREHGGNTKTWGSFAEEVGWWHQVFDEMMGELRDTIEECQR
ncbi:nucleotide-diphospho-sugar transferase [Rhodocollybia butyracea]|uniref:Nucleotide-diphospho-sugar transferase n=1 Tax=Rhodocollybia butyracea TaxID=206335 RepID=A0A9P5PQZ0_9AGAR|nr:nucleotide-diphospho-sugar transferase [Rhodocollybia butyracea]